LPYCEFPFLLISCGKSLPMKFLLLLLCSLSYGFIMAQDCRAHLLMQKGVQLEYRVLWPTADSGIYRSANRLLFEVIDVKDSAGSTWSSITKRGIGVFDSTKHYERNVVLQCEDRRLLIPYDFYLTDTIYTRDFYQKPVDRLPDNYGYAVAFTPLVDAITYIIPLNLECTVSLPEGKKKFEQKVKRGYRDVIPFTSKPYDVWPFNILSTTLAGKENVTTPADIFACYKFCMEIAADDDPEPLKFWLYFNREVGLVKFEAARIRVVLNSIKK